MNNNRFRRMWGRLRAQARCLGVTTVALSPFLLSGCASFSPDAGLSTTKTYAAVELDKDVVKITNEAEAISVKARVDELLRRPLTPDSAVQIALLQNKALQASFNELGVAEAQFVLATLPPAPRVSVTRLAASMELEIERVIALNLLQLVTLPVRTFVAEQRFRSAQFRAAESMLRLAAEARRQYYRTVAANQAVSFLEQALASAESASELATRLGETGALNKLEQAREHAFYTELGAQLARSRVQRQVQRERLIRQLGVWGRDTDFRLPVNLPALPARIETARALEQLAMNKRVDLQVVRFDIQSRAGQFGLNQAIGFISVFEIGAASTFEKSKTVTVKEDGDVEVDIEKSKRRGFEVDLQIPIYDFGTTAVRGAREAYFAAANGLAARATNARSQVRESYFRYRGNLDIARHYQNRVLPLRRTIQEQALLQYSGMLIDVTQLIIDARARILSNIAAIEARRDFWIAATDLKASIIGGVAREEGEPGEAAEGGENASVAAVTPGGGAPD